MRLRVPVGLALGLLCALGAGLAPCARAQAPARWAPIGPSTIRGETSGQPLAGRVTSLAVDPSDARHWLIGTPAGGSWRSTDAGSSWTPLGDAQASLAIGAVAIAPGQPQTYYAGTGDRAGSVGTYAGVGLLRSTDAGASWTLRGSSTFAGSSFSALLVDPRDARVLLATTERGAAGLDPELRLRRVPARGIFKSTDGGDTWTRRGPARADVDATDLVVDPGQFNRAFAAVGSQPSRAANGLWRSLDGGESWGLVAGPWNSARGGAGRMQLALAPSNPSVLYVAVTNASTLGLLGLWKTTDAWSSAPTFTRVPTDATDGRRPGHGFCGNRCWFALRLSVDPRDADTLYAGGLRLWRCASCGAAPEWRATSPRLHVDQHALAWAGRRLLVGNDGGVWSTLDGGQTFTAHNDGLEIAQFWAGCLHPTRADWALGGGQDNGVQHWTGARDWAWVGVAGDGGSCAISAARPDTHWEDGLLRTLDGATTGWHNASTGIDWSEPKVFVTPVAKCPAQDNVFIAGLSSVWRTSEFFSAALPFWQSNGGPWGEALSALAFAPSDASCRTYAVGSRSGQALKLTTDGGASWGDLDPGGVLPRGYVSALAFDSRQAGTLYVAFARFSGGPGGHLFRGTSVGSGAPVWTDVSAPVDLPHNALALDPQRPDTLYVGTDDGLWATGDGGLTWVSHGPAQGLPRAPIYDVQLQPGTQRLVAFTHGRGAFKLLRADLEASGSVETPSDADEVAFRFAVLNRGPDAAESVTLEAQLAPGLARRAIEAPSGACEEQERVVTCRFGTLAVGQAAEVRVRATHEADGATAAAASVTSAVSDPRADNNHATPVLEQR